MRTTIDICLIILAALILASALLMKPCTIETSRVSFRADVNDKKLLEPEQMSQLVNTGRTAFYDDGVWIVLEGIPYCMMK